MAKTIRPVTIHANPSEIRLASPADIERLIEIDHIAANSLTRRQFITHSADNQECYVLSNGKSVVAYGVLDYSFFQNGFISMLYVAAKARRSGFGSRLLQFMERECHTSKVFTSTNASNTPMRALLAKLGYQPSGTIENLDDDDIELVFLKRR